MSEIEKDLYKGSVSSPIDKLSFLGRPDRPEAGLSIEVFLS